MSDTPAKVQPADAPDGETFFRALEDIDDGGMLHQLDEGFTRLVSAVLATGGKGKLVLTLAVDKCGSERQVRIRPAVKLTAPSDDIQGRILFASESGHLCKNDPKQKLLDLDAPQKVTRRAANTQPAA